MKTGKMIGKGMTAEVYQWGKDRVLKLFLQGFSDERINYEAEVGCAVHEAGVPSPALYGIVDVDGRKGIIFQRIFGKSILRHVEGAPWKLDYFVQQMAGLHFKMHGHSADRLPSQKERLASAINQSSEILGDKEKRVLTYLKSLPEGTSVCHGDLHFDNIIVSDNGLVAIDWANAYRGNPLGDVARTCLTISSPTMPLGTSNIMIMSYMYGKWLTLWGYLNEYKRLAQIKSEYIDAWILPVAAAKLREKIPGEEKWLMDTIDKHLERFDA